MFYLKISILLLFQFQLDILIDDFKIVGIVMIKFKIHQINCQNIKISNVN